MPLVRTPPFTAPRSRLAPTAALLCLPLLGGCFDNRREVTPALEAPDHRSSATLWTIVAESPGR